VEISFEFAKIFKNMCISAVGDSAKSASALSLVSISAVGDSTKMTSALLETALCCIYRDSMKSAFALSLTELMPTYRFL
jgi:hypothetical protein